MNNRLTKHHFSLEAENKQNETRLELKYCEHCGGLWLRDCGSQEVYCAACRPRVAQLPARSLRRARPVLPGSTRPVRISDFDFEIDDELLFRVEKPEVYEEDEVESEAEDHNDDRDVDDRASDGDGEDDDDLSAMGGVA
jgi:hypothetical protein